MIGVARIWKNSIFSRLFWTFLFIIVPLYFLGFNIYIWGMQTVRSEITNTMTSQVSFYMESLEMDIQRMHILQYEFINDEDLSDLAIISETMDNYEKSRAILRLQQRLSAIKNSSPYILDVRAHIPSIDITLSPQRAPDKLDVREFNMLRQAKPQSDSQIIYLEDRMVLSLIHPQYQQNSSKVPLYILTIELSIKSINSALRQFDNHIGSGSFLIHSSQEYFAIKGEQRLEITEKMQDWFNDWEEMGAKQGSGSVPYGGKHYLAIYTMSDYLDMTLCKYIPEDEVFVQLRQYKRWFWIFSLASVILIALYSFSTYKFIHEPLQTLLGSFRQLEKGDLNISIQHDHNDEFRDIYRRFNAMVERLGALIDQVYIQKILNQKAELKQLQSQINPHFLYNSFFILSRMIKGREYENATQFTQHLGEYFKFITRSTADEVPLEKEVEHAHIYTRIQEMRFSRRLRVEFGELRPGYHGFIIPRLIIQPIIENAFEHGLENKKSGGLIIVSFVQIEDEFKIVVEDNGEELSDLRLTNLKQILASRRDAVEQTGLLNIHRRIQLMFGINSGLVLSRSTLGGLMVEMNLIIRGRTHDV